LSNSGDKDDTIIITTALAISHIHAALLHAFFRDLSFLFRLFSFLFSIGPPVFYARDLSRGVFFMLVRTDNYHASDLLACSRHCPSIWMHLIT
jgi:hypothetical protein